MQPSPHPDQVSISNAAQTFTMSWEDGHQSIYPWWYLRGLCPCAACQGHRGPTRFVSEADTVLGEVDEVGNYALRLVWNESHKTGIYSFAYLRELCPCAACQKAAGGDHLAGLLDAEQHARLSQVSR